MQEYPYTFRLPSREKMASGFSGEQNIDQRFLPFFAPHANKEMTGLGLLLGIVYASISISRSIEKADSLVLHFGPKLVDLLVDDPQMNEYVKMLIRMEFAERNWLLH